MAKSNAERQAVYRARHLKDEGGTGERLNLVIDLHAKRALERLAVCYGRVFIVTDGGLHHHLAASGNFGQVIRKNYLVAVGNRMMGGERKVPRWSDRFARCSIFWQIAWTWRRPRWAT